MGIASGVFWIVFGLLYILYQAFKEHPSETAAGVIACVVVVGGLIGFTCLYRWLMDQNLVLGSIFAFGGLGAFCIWFFRFWHREHTKRKNEQEEYNAWMNKVRASMTEKDYEDYARAHCRMYRANMDPNSVLYWKNEPYYSKIKFMAEIKRSCDMKTELDAAKIPNCTSEES